MVRVNLWDRGHNFRWLWINPSPRVTWKIGGRIRDLQRQRHHRAPHLTFGFCQGLLGGEIQFMASTSQVPQPTCSSKSKWVGEPDYSCIWIWATTQIGCHLVRFPNSQEGRGTWLGATTIRTLISWLWWRTSPTNITGVSCRAIFGEFSPSNSQPKTRPKFNICRC